MSQSYGVLLCIFTLNTEICHKLKQTAKGKYKCVAERKLSRPNRFWVQSLRSKRSLIKIKIKKNYFCSQDLNLNGKTASSEAIAWTITFLWQNQKVTWHIQLYSSLPFILAEAQQSDLPKVYGDFKKEVCRAQIQGQKRYRIRSRNSDFLNCTSFTDKKT